MESIIPTIRDEEARRRVEKRLEKARERSVLEHDYPQLVHANGQAPTIKDDPPLIFHWREHAQEGQMAAVHAAFAAYRDSLPEYRRMLLDRFRLMDIAIKVVGVGSVGTFCGILLLMAGEEDPLFLQVKQARPSVLERYAGKSRHGNHGQRIVVGCQLMQSASDLFLGWTEGQKGRHFYVRQLRDVKVKVLVEVFSPSVMVQYAELCGWTLARAPCPLGRTRGDQWLPGKDRGIRSGHRGVRRRLRRPDRRDYDVFMKAVRAGRLEVSVEPE